MSMQVLASAIEKTYASDLVRGELTIIWHAGEPLAVPISWYEEALATISANCSDRGEYRPFDSVQWHLAKPKRGATLSRVTTSVSDLVLTDRIFFTICTARPGEATAATGQRCAASNC